MAYDNRLHYEEDQIEEFAALICTCATEHGTPNFAIDLAGFGTRQVSGPMGYTHVLYASGLTEMARRWRVFEFQPPEFADRIDVLAAAVSSQPHGTADKNSKEQR